MGAVEGQQGLLAQELRGGATDWMLLRVSWGGGLSGVCHGRGALVSQPGPGAGSTARACRPVRAGVGRYSVDVRAAGRSAGTRCHDDLRACASQRVRDLGVNELRRCTRQFTGARQARHDSGGGAGTPLDHGDQHAAGAVAGGCLRLGGRVISACGQVWVPVMLIQSGPSASPGGGSVVADTSGAASARAASAAASATGSRRMPGTALGTAAWRVTRLGGRFRRVGNDSARLRPGASAVAGHAERHHAGAAHHAPPAGAPCSAQGTTGHRTPSTWRFPAGDGVPPAVPHSVHAPRCGRATPTGPRTALGAEAALLMAFPSLCRIRTGRYSRARAGTTATSGSSPGHLFGGSIRPRDTS